MHAKNPEQKKNIIVDTRVLSSSLYYLLKHCCS